MSEKVLYVFFHIPKTGGTSFRFHLRRFFRNDQILFLYRDFYPQLDTNEKVGNFISNLTAGQRQKIKVVIGHKVYYGIDRLFPDREVRYVVFFRHPADRIISRYNFSRTLLVDYPEHYQLNDVIQNGQIVDFFDFIKQSPFSNNSAYRFLLEHGMGSEEQSADQNLDSIKNILSKFYFVGLTEKSNEDFLFLFYRLGLSPLALRLNASRKFYEPRLDDLATRLQTRNEIDYKIYDWAVSLNQKSKDDDFYKVVRKMKVKRFVHAPYFVVFLLFFELSEFLARKSKTYTRFLEIIGRHRYNKF